MALNLRLFIDFWNFSYERDEAGWWIARVHGVAGAHSNGRSIAEARGRVRVALALAIGDSGSMRAATLRPVKIKRRLEVHP